MSANYATGYVRGSTLAVAVAVAMALGANRPAYSQTTTDDTGGQPEQGLQEVTVTASRIQRAGFEAPTPTTMVNAAEIENRASPRISQIIFDIPAMRPTATAVPFSGSAGGTYANLRNLNPGVPTQSATRTLVLVDGRRIVPNTANGAIDLNSIPTSLVERVDVVTGGASAAWGSDAVAGVVNFILKKKIEGFEGSVQYGQSQRNDQKDKSASLAWGTDYAGGRGQFMIAGEYDSLYDAPRAGDRSWGRNQWGLVSGTLNGINVSRIRIPGVTSSSVAYGGVIVGTNGRPLPATGPNSALRGIQFGLGGAVEPFTYGSFLSTNQMVGGSGAVMSTLSALTAPVDRQNVYARTTFDFTERTQGWVEFSYALSQSVVDSQPAYIPNGDPILTIQRDSAFLPTSIRTTMTANNLSAFGLGRITPEFGTYVRVASGTNVRRGAAGLNGQLGDNWTWKMYLGDGQTHYYDETLNNLNEPNLRAAIDSVIGPNGTPICRINSTAAADVAIVSAPGYQGRGAAAGCVAANPFGPGSLSSAVAAYVVGTSAAVADFEQQTAGASIQGEPFSTWADKVSVAAGVDYRKDSVNQTSDAVAQFSDPAFQVGGWQFANRKPMSGSYRVTEFFGEVVVPLAKDLAFAKALDLNAAVRATDYSTSGNVTSWKVGLTYKPIDSLLLRGTRSRDIRAANLVELYTQAAATVSAVVDYGRTGNPSVSVPISAIGNPNLKPEIADTDTFGISWQPVGTGFHASLDYYRINLTNAIGSLGGQNIVNACYGHAPFIASVAAACALIARDSTGVITNISNSSLNLAFTDTDGEDLELGYQMRLSQLFSRAAGTLDLRVLGTHLNSLNVNNGIVTVDQSGQVGNSKWRYTANATYINGPALLFLQGRYLSSAVIDNSYGPTDINDNHVPSAFYLNGTFQYTIATKADTRGQLQAFLNINNILDRDPPIISSASAVAGQVSLSPDYDVLGRYFTVGLRFKY